MPLVTVVIPTYNRAELLRLTVRSVLDQTYPAVEIIIVDDGSTDDTPAVLAEFGDRVTVIRQQNQGGTAARNTGVRAAHGEFISFLDHDDVLLPTKIARQVRLLQARPEYGVAHCRWYFVDPAGRRLTRIGALPEGDVFRALILGCFIWSGGPLLRRQCLDKAGMFDESIWSSDWDMWVRLARVYRFGCVQLPLGEYRILPDSTMADVARTERMDAGLFDKIFRDPDLPAPFVNLRPEALANWRFWLSRRYYASGDWDAARRNWSQAIADWPELMRDPTAVLHTLCDEALDVRVSDAEAYIEGALAHLPPEAQRLQARRAEALSRVQLGLALRDVARADIAAAHAHMRTAGELHPAALQSADAFARFVFEWAMRLPGDPVTFTAHVYGHLPAEARELQRGRERARSDAEVGQAFEEFYAGRFACARARVLRAVRSRPAVLRNRGVQAILLRSFARGPDEPEHATAPVTSP